jgi:hypothetical protein
LACNLKMLVNWSNGICGDVGGWYDSCNGVGHVDGGTYEGIRWS